MNTIPKICHLYWDKSPMSLLQTFTVVSFHRHNPDWKIKIYLTKQRLDEMGLNIHTRDYKGEDYFHLIRALDYVEFEEVDLVKWKINTEVHACSSSDLFRRNILYKEGGVYSDFDNVWLKPMDHIREVDCIGNPNDFESLVCFYNYTKDFHNVSNLISEPKSPYLYSLIETQQKIHPPYHHQSFGSVMVNRKYPDLHSIQIKFPRILAIKYETFYPYSIFNLEQLYKKDELNSLNNRNVIGVHWFNGHEYSKDYVNGNGFSIKCSMTSILKKEGYI
jgi:hypothetical protein